MLSSIWTVFTSVGSRSGTIEDASLDSIVAGPSIPGDGVRLRDALAAGFISKDEAGNYVAGPGVFNPADEKSLADPKPDEAKDGDDEAKDGDDDTLEGLGDEVETVMNSLVEGSSPHVQLDAVHQVAATGEVSEDLIQQVAQDMGVAPEVLQGQLGGVIDAFEVQAREAITKVAGVDSETVLEWVRENRMDALNKAMIDQGTNRTTSGYTALANEYVATMDQHSPDAILNATFPAGQSASRDSNGKIVITVDGVGYPWASAVRAGFVSIS